MSPVRWKLAPGAYGVPAPLGAVFQPVKLWPVLARPLIFASTDTLSPECNVSPVEAGGAPASAPLALYETE